MIVVMIYYPGGLSGLWKAFCRKLGLTAWTTAYKH